MTSQRFSLPLPDSPHAEERRHYNPVGAGRDGHHDLQTIFDFIVVYKCANDGNSPTIREIGQACGISSTSFVSNILARLERQGLIRLPKVCGVSRHIHVVGGQWSYHPTESSPE